LTLHKLDQVLEGGMDEFVVALRAQRDHAAAAEET
jgi:protein subunit release factor A